LTKIFISKIYIDFLFNINVISIFHVNKFLFPGCSKFQYKCSKFASHKISNKC